ncbi:MAG: NYN domain-containing protein, partial [Kiritimatiellia bacterium]|nr:NYN domain-containing protein [Kiritimatiellia bacterium]
ARSVPPGLSARCPSCQIAPVWDRLYVVFDGDSSVIGGDITASAPGVRALYNKTGETADRRIRRMLEQADRREEITVVSDDNEVRDSARVHHMQAMSALDFGRIGVRNRSTNSRTAERRTTKGRKRTEEAETPLPPAAERAITDELRDLWDA